MSEEKEFDISDAVTDDVTDDTVKEDEGKQEEQPGVEAEKPKDEPPSVPPVKEDDSDKEWTKAMALDERKKRQEIEAELREYKEKAAAKPQESDRIPDDILDEPKKLAAYVKDAVKEQTSLIKIQLSADMIRDKHEDYDDVIGEFKKLAASNPALLDEMANAANPAAYAYDLGKKSKDVERYKDPNFRENLEAEIRAKVLAELQGSKTKINVPPILTNTTAVAANGVVSDKQSPDTTDKYF